eukprot:364770-Chlamydomonas_euryale.AAC.3
MQLLAACRGVCRRGCPRKRGRAREGAEARKRAREGAEAHKRTREGVGGRRSTQGGAGGRRRGRVGATRRKSVGCCWCSAAAAAAFAALAGLAAAAVAALPVSAAAVAAGLAAADDDLAPAAAAALAALAASASEQAPQRPAFASPLFLPHPSPLTPLCSCLPPNRSHALTHHSRLNRPRVRARAGLGGCRSCAGCRFQRARSETPRGWKRRLRCQGTSGTGRAGRA